MAGELIYAYRVMRLPLLDAEGDAIGRIEDIVVLPTSGGRAPRVMGFVASSGRRKIFVNAHRIARIDNDGVAHRSWDIDLKPFTPRAGEILVSELLDRRVGTETVSDVALRASDEGAGDWEIANVRMARRRPLRRRPSYRIVDWDSVPELFTTDEMAAEAARLRDLHPSDVALALAAMPIGQRRQLAEMMEDDRLADLLEELPEAEQVELIEGLGLDRVVAVLEEMAYDDLADLLAELPGEKRATVLDAMDADDADVLRRLLSYAEGTAGALMTPEVIILGQTATVAEALAAIRDPERPVSVATQVFVTQPPYVPPTGAYLGLVHFQRLLREPPAMEIGRCIEHEPTIPPDLPEPDVAERLASYNLLAVGVCDDVGHLLGAVTVDDVLDRALPAGWRKRRQGAPT